MPASISVIVPAYQAERYLAATLHSILGQSGDHDLEVIVVDDVSTDQTGDIATSFGDAVELIRLTENMGPAGARNAALARAGGELIMFLDSDDLWPTDAITQRLTLLNDHPEIDVLAGAFKCIPGEFDESVGPMDDYTPEQWWSFIPSASTIRRRAFDTVGVFDPALRGPEDTDWYLRARASELNIFRDRRCHTLYRQHASSLTATNRAKQKSDLFSAIRRNRSRSAPAES